MARITKPLSDAECRRAKPQEAEYRLTDGGGLILAVKPNGSKHWRLKFRKLDGKESMLALGEYPAIGLAEARRLREEARRLVAKGIDPVSERRNEKRAAQARAMSTFEAIANDWHKLNGAHSSRRSASGEKSWSPDHAHKIFRRMELHLFPALAQRPITEISFHELKDTLHLRVLPHGRDVTLRVCQYLRSIFDHARILRLRSDNPAEGLQRTLPPLQRSNHAALPLKRLPELVQKIRCYKGLITRLSMQFALLTGVRSSEFRFAHWDEFDVDAAMWTIPPERQAVEGVKHSERAEKMKDTRLVPLSRQTLAVLAELRRINGHRRFVFASSTADKPLSEGGVNSALRCMGYDTKEDLTLHGFRALFCSALVESGLWNRDAIERQMGHAERNAVRAAYIHKAEFLHERVRMMQWWADYLESDCLPSNVVLFPVGAAA
ncbi:tyrosine-type recombinase/integrase [Chitinilyticum aquatile]|uniref:tyrosine-type recombinase/integrase n=1 Tax=Chitinilyticum aquatile TaxID=362520 RepID=UPI0003FA31FB|nr:integrase arm-type DNA-binding domain-containing protein [Chitinilyticum aquatile]